MAIEDDTTGDVVHRRRLKDFRSRLERVSGEGKRFLGGMGDLGATSRRKQWNDNRAILRNKKLISNSFVRFG